MPSRCPLIFVWMKSERRVLIILCSSGSVWDIFKNLPERHTIFSGSKVRLLKLLHLSRMDSSHSPPPSKAQFVYENKSNKNSWAIYDGHQVTKHGNCVKLVEEKCRGGSDSRQGGEKPFASIEIIDYFLSRSPLTQASRDSLCRSSSSYSAEPEKEEKKVHFLRNGMVEDDGRKKIGIKKTMKPRAVSSSCGPTNWV